jgi:hypothetical protein
MLFYLEVRTIAIRDVISFKFENIPQYSEQCYVFSKLDAYTIPKIYEVLPNTCTLALT